MYVVVEFNQASGQPELAGTEIYDTQAEAIEYRDYAQAETDEVGRRERYEVYELVEVADD